MINIDFMRFPGEIRNSIYSTIIRGLPQTITFSSLPAIAYTSLPIHQEFMSQYLPQLHFDIVSMCDIWHMHAVLDSHPRSLGWHRITKLTITNFTSIAHTQTRANEVMDFVCQFTLLANLIFDITLDDLSHGFEGRTKDIHHIFTEFELFRLLTFNSLKYLVINIRCNGLSLTPGSFALLSHLKEALTADTDIEVTLVLRE
ncbi:hypothetical protein EKO04_000998 [Ascochyta lentis]|uniref:Uncharacterized protein n=1 Tax=Ascochyta lentis TaxID=205686 RepID=A0A8H7MMU6_9PLEO|nr:hypothetical protein EKO04_000998 [Ascochyta lentis]